MEVQVIYVCLLQMTYTVIVMFTWNKQERQSDFTCLVKKACVYIRFV